MYSPFNRDQLHTYNVLESHNCLLWMPSDMWYGQQCHVISWWHSAITVLIYGISLFNIFHLLNNSHWFYYIYLSSPFQMFGYIQFSKSNVQEWSLECKLAWLKRIYSSTWVMQVTDNDDDKYCRSHATQEKFAYMAVFLKWKTDLCEDKKHGEIADKNEEAGRPCSCVQSQMKLQAVQVLKQSS